MIALSIGLLGGLQQTAHFGASLAFFTILNIASYLAHILAQRQINQRSCNRNHFHDFVRREHRCTI